MMLRHRVIVACLLESSILNFQHQRRSRTCFKMFRFAFSDIFTASEVSSETFEAGTRIPSNNEGDGSFEWGPTLLTTDTFTASDVYSKTFEAGTIGIFFD